jgi:translation initiation factor IF-1
LARDDLIQATGTVDKILGGGRYQVALDGGQAVTAQLSGRMRRFRIRVIPGDRVQVGLSPTTPRTGSSRSACARASRAPLSLLPGLRARYSLALGLPAFARLRLAARRPTFQSASLR